MSKAPPADVKAARRIAHPEKMMNATPINVNAPDPCSKVLRDYPAPSLGVLMVHGVGDLSRDPRNPLCPERLLLLTYGSADGSMKQA